MLGGYDGLDRVTAGQVHLRVAQWLGAEEAGDAGDQCLGGVWLAVAELAEQVLFRPDVVDAARLGNLSDDLGELEEGF